MDPDMGVSRVAAAVMAVGSAATAGTGAATQQMVFEIMPQSYLFAAIAGALIGVVILPNKEAGLIVPTGPVWQKLAMYGVRLGALAAAVLSYALLAGATVHTAVVFFHGIEAAGVSISLIAGAFIRPLLPKYLEGVEGITSRMLGLMGAK